MKVFVIMPFKEQFKKIYHDIIEPTCNILDLLPVLADNIKNPAKPIPEEIFENIRESLFVIAEVSEQNDNVFLELGYAFALRKKIILISNKKRKLPFDIKVVRTLFYAPKNKDWAVCLNRKLGDSIRHLFDLSQMLEIRNLSLGQELQGNLHRISGQLFRLYSPGHLWFFNHLWFFVKREDLDRWSPQNDGEVQVRPDGTWEAELYLGWTNNIMDINKNFDIKFGLVDTVDNRELTDFCVNQHIRGDFSGIRQLPRSFQELANIVVRRVA